MATPVPYEGAPDRVPGQEGISPIQSGANPAAFGVNLAEATQHLGQVVEGSGKELFDRAYAMQELQVHADVNSRLADAQNQMMNKFVDFSQKEGKNAVDGLPQFQNDIDGIRLKAGEGLSPVGQEFYDQESRQSRYRLAFAGAEHAAGQQKAYVMGSADAQISSAQKMMEVNPNDPATTEKSLQTIRDSVKLKFGDIGGMSDVEVKSKQADAVNTAVNGRIRSMAKDDPIGAEKLFDQATKDGDLYGDAATNLHWYIQNQRDTVGARTTAGSVFSGAALGPTPAPAWFNARGGGGLDQKDMNPVFASRLQKAVTDAEAATGAGVQFTSLARSTEKQAELYAQYKAGTGGLAAPPGMSLHEQGLAADMKAGPALDWLHQHAADYGIEFLKGRAGIVDSGHVQIAGGKVDPADISQHVPLQTLVNKGAEIAEAQFPGDSGYKTRVTDNIISQYNKEKSIRADTDNDNEQAVWGTLLNGVGPNHKIPTSVDELKLDPKAAEAWDQLQASHPSELKKYLNQMASNAKGDVAMTTDRLQSWQNLSGQAVNDPQGFMAKTADVSSLDLPMKEKLAVLSMRQAIYKKQDANPQVGAALATINRLNMLAPLGLTKAENPEGLATFTGVLSDAMTQYQQTNQKPMSADDIKTTAQQLLSPVGGRHFWNSTQPWFESIDQVPEDAAESIREELQNRGTPVSDAAILSNYLAAQYQEIFGKTQSRPVK